MHVNRSPRAAFTLLEVILALALSALLLGALAMAIQTSLKATYSGRADVAEAQLARAALERIGNDLRAAVWVEQPDPASLVVPPSVASLSSTSSSGGPGGSPGSPQMASSANAASSANSSSSRSGGSNASGGSSTSGGGSATSSGSGGGGSSGGGNRGGSGGSGGGGSAGGGGAGGGAGGGGTGSSGGSNSSNGSSTTTVQMPMPMFIGGQNWLQVDVSHLPRPDQYAFLQTMGGNAAAGNTSTGNSATGNSLATSAATARDRISEMKTVYYFLAGASGGGGQMPPGLSAGMTSGQQGLMRREADRAVTAWTTYGGGSAGFGPALEALAPEIESLNFQYFNGSAWTTTWDSRMNYCLPRAVEIRITLAGETATKESPRRPDSRSRNRAPPKEYVLRVPLPAWRPPNLQLLNTLANQAASGSGSSTSGSSTSGGAGGMGSY